MAITTDSAANNNTFMKFFAEHCERKDIFHVDQRNSHINCFAHVLNLAAKKFMKTLSSAGKKRKRPVNNQLASDDDDEFGDEGDEGDSVPVNLIQKVKT